MLIGALLILTWLVLLVRYPLRAVPISLGALLALGLVAGWVLWQEQREQDLLGRLEVRLEYAPGQCPAGQPLHIRVRNDSGRPLLSLQWDVAAYAPGTRTNLAQRRYDAPDYEGPGDLQPGAEWQSCLPLPALRTGYRASTLEFRAVDLRGRFSD